MKGQSKRRGRTTRQLTKKGSRQAYARRWAKDDGVREVAVMKPSWKRRWAWQQTKITDATGRSECEDVPMWLLEGGGEDPLVASMRDALEDEYGPFDKSDANDVLFDWADKDRVVDSTAGLDELDKAIFKLHLREHSYREIADLLGVSASTVGNRVRRSCTEIAKKVIVYSESAKQIASCWNEQAHVAENRHLTHCRGLRPLDNSKAAAQPCAKTVCSQTGRPVTYCPFAYPEDVAKKNALSDLPERKDWAYWQGRKK